MSDIDLRPEVLLPHDHPMILIDRVIEFGENFTIATITPDPGKPFASASGNVPAWVGIEYMAQTIGAYAGIQAQRSGAPVKVGFLLGTRLYKAQLDTFENGQTYSIRVSKIYEDDGLSAFECIISLLEDKDNAILAQATINTFQPENVDEFLEAGEG